jgi:hypothetical protein
MRQVFLASVDKKAHTFCHNFEGIFSFVWMATVVDDTKVQTILVYDMC